MLWQRLRDMLIMAAAANVSAAAASRMRMWPESKPKHLPPRQGSVGGGQGRHVTQWQDINVKQLPLVQYSQKSRQTHTHTLSWHMYVGVQRSRKIALNFLKSLKWKS